ncbi:MAG: BrnT family toxin [Blastocatellia bacterium]
MDFEWDPQKANSNQRRRRIDFADAVTVFDDEFALTIPDDHPDEERYVTIGMDALARLLVVVWTYRAENIRIISARKATRFEQRQYNEGI